MKRRRSISPAVGLSLVLLIGLLAWSPLGPLTGLGAAEEGEDRPIVVEGEQGEKKFASPRASRYASSLRRCSMSSSVCPPHSGRPRGLTQTD